MPQRHPAHPFGEVAHPDVPFPVTPEALGRLRGFLDVSDWRCIYGINMETNVPSVATDEAEAAKVAARRSGKVCELTGASLDARTANFNREAAVVPVRDGVLY